MSVTTRLTWMQKKTLQNHFEGKHFSLIFKASVQGFDFSTLHGICSCQGPIAVVIYSGDLIIGAYMQYNSQNALPAPIVLFVLHASGISEFRIGPFDTFEIFYETSISQCGFYINLKDQEATLMLKIIESLGLPKSSFLKGKISFQECEAFRCEDVLDERNMTGIRELNRNLWMVVKTHKPHRDLVHQVRMLLLGPVGAGKSSFINSVKSVFQGHVTHQVLEGFDKTGMSEAFRTYTVRDGKDGKFLPFILCDSMGLDEEQGICMDDITYILKGHVSDRYQFNPIKPITRSHSNYISDPYLKDRIHCVAFVLNANSVDHLSHEMIEKIRRIRREMIKLGVVHVVLLTNVDSLDLITKSDFLDIYRCVPVKSKIEAVHKKLGVALSDILVVSNYTSGWELDTLKDFLILSVLRQLLWAADDFLEDLPHC
ncbi:interferon-induced protein 44 [Sorex araneus]|uniref:interferon-induced protein 44 n=1 Tax=Sorex araneus TaxID=42254 RepID=UPI0024340591|nr:interferon-induced protein 44 [Sorex araneus]